MGPVRDFLVEEMPCLGEMQQNECNCRHKDDEEEQDPGAWNMHPLALPRRLCFRLWAHFGIKN